MNAAVGVETPLRVEHERMGAQFALRFGTLLPETYDGFAAEYRRAREAAAVVDTNFQFVAELTGPDRVRYLNAVSTGNIRDLQPGESATGLLLNPQGHILAELRTLAIEDRLLVVSHSMVAARTLQTLDRYIIMDDVTLSDCTADYGFLAIVGPRAAALIDDLAGGPKQPLTVGRHAELTLGGIPCRLHSPSHLGLQGAEILTARERMAELLRLALEAASRYGGGVAGYAAVDAFRLEQGVPWFGADFDDRVIPHEAGLELSHISYTKGCYTGQEIVERVRSRGQVNRRRVGLIFTGQDLPLPGSKLTSEGKELGWVTSAAPSALAGRAIGMGYLRRELSAPGSRLDWAAGTAEVVSLPLQDNPAPATESE